MSAYRKARACRFFAGSLLAASLLGALPAYAFEPDNARPGKAEPDSVGNGLHAAVAIDGVATADAVFEAVSKRAADLAQATYVPPADNLPAPFRNLDYDGFRKLRARPDAAIWGKAGNPFAILPLPRGGLYGERVNLWLVEDGAVEPVSDTARFVDFVDFPNATDAERQQLGVSGWRAILAPGQAGVGYEAAVFQGGVYFRAAARDMVYGASARALAIAPGSPTGEEFPRFTDFWIIRPAPGETTLTAIALMDTPGATGAYRFTLRPGRETVVIVEADIHPRIDMAEAGIAPVSSMYEHGAADHLGSSDWRPEVHDSDGLLIVTASGERIWRPLANPKGVQISSFGEASPRGFGLIQRERSFASYSDLEAKYEKRPSVWIEPAGDWGDGTVQLIEIPTPTEYNDNIAAFWRPAAPWKRGEAHRLSYRLRLGPDGPDAGAIAKVVSTRIGAAPDRPDLRRIVIDFSGDHHFAAAARLADVWCAAGAIHNVQVSDGANAFSRRLTFDLDPQGAPLVELHAALGDETSQLTETWLFRWTPE